MPAESPTSNCTRSPANFARYIGRFAPSPTGSLHFGSLAAAVGSYLDARHHGGRWLVRIEDLDTSRVIPGCADEMLRTLDAFGLHWDGPVEYQSRRLDAYEAALDSLRTKGLTYQCTCSRKRLAELEESGYPGTCRERGIADSAAATRLRIDDAARIVFEDRIQGECAYAMRDLGDVIVRRRDGVFAYQLAVAVDDAHQQITDVVRGADLIESTPWQIALQRALGFATPRYAHLPLIVEPDGTKLAKSKRSVPANATGRSAADSLVTVLQLLGQQPSLDFESVTDLLFRAATRWNPERFHRVKSVPAPFSGRK
jgi:glutamyl-Q tRNA(Asp) synthetase